MAGFESAAPDLKPLLGQRISRLGLKLEGSPMEGYVAELYRELEAKGLKRFRPLTYFTDEWGCPSEEPIIGIPFYLADANLAASDGPCTHVRQLIQRRLAEVEQSLATDAADQGRGLPTCRTSEITEGGDSRESDALHRVRKLPRGRAHANGCEDR